MVVLVRTISQDFTKCLINIGAPSTGIDTLKTCIKKIQISPFYLTSMHADLCQVLQFCKIF